MGKIELTTPRGGGVEEERERLVAVRKGRRAAQRLGRFAGRKPKVISAHMGRKRVRRAPVPLLAASPGWPLAQVLGSGGVSMCEEKWGWWSHRCTGLK